MMKRSVKRKFNSYISVLLVISVILSLLLPFNITAFAAEAAEGKNIRALIYEIDGTNNYELVFQNESREVEEGRKVIYDSFGIADKTENEVDISNLSSNPSWVSNSSITTVTINDVIRPKSTLGWFNGLTRLSKINNIEKLDTSEVTTFKSMFLNCRSLTELDVSNFDTSEVTNMNDTFNGCYNLTELNVRNWDVRKLQISSGCFYHCRGLTALDVSQWSTPELTDMQGMFRECINLKVLDLSSWNFGNVTKIRRAFSAWDHKNSSSTYRMALETIIFPENMNSSNIIDWYEAFYRCSNLKTIDLSGVDFAKVQNCYRMFADCTSLESIITDGGFNGLGTYSSCDTRYMFYNCSALKSLDLWKATRIATNTDMLSGLNSLVEIKLGEKWKAGAGSLEADTWKPKNGTDDQAISQYELISNYNSSYAGTWVAQTEIEFNGTGGIPSSQGIKAFIGDTINISSIADPTRSGYVFLGWYTDKNDGDPVSPDGDGNLVANQAVYYAHWDDHHYDLIVHGNGGTLDEDVASELGGEKITLNEGTDNKETAVKFSKLSYSEFQKLSRGLYTTDETDKILSRWNTNASGSGNNYDANGEVSKLSTIDGGTAHLYAIWHDLDATVTYHYQNGDSETTETRKYSVADDTVIELFEPEYQYHTFMGWYTLPSGGTEVTDTGDNKTIINRDLEIYAQWKDDPLITLNANGGKFENGSESYSKYVKYNTAIGYLQEPENGTMSLKEWNTKADGSGTVYTSNSTATTALTLYAQWGYKPIFNANGGVITSSAENPVQTSSEYIIHLPEATRQGYKFLGWYHGDSLVTEGSTIDLSTDNEITARWEKTGIYVITLDPNGEDAEVSRETIEVAENMKIGELPNPTRDGYEFDGWYDGSGTKYDINSTFSEDTKIYAKWIEKDITLTFDPEGGQIYGTDTADTNLTVNVVSGKTLNELPSASKKDTDQTSMFFAGWYSNLNDPQTKLTKETAITTDTTYHAKWEPFYTKVGDAYKYHVGWYNPTSDDATVNGNDLSLHPVTDGKVEAMLHVNFEKSDTGEALSRGAVRITVPKTVFTDKDSNAITDTNIDEFTKKEFRPEDPDDEGEALFNYYETENSYVFYNNKTITQTGGSYFTLKYYADPWKLSGGYTDNNGNYGGKYFKNENISVGIAINDTYSSSVGLTLEAHTKVEAEASKTFTGNVYTTWQSGWDSKYKPDDASADDYFYVQWRLRDTIYSTTNQPYKISWSEDTVHDGKVITGLTESVIYTDTGNKDTYIITMHPLSDIPDGKTWITLNNEAIVTETWDSGYTTSQRVSAKAEVNIQKTGGNGRYFYKYISGYTTLSNHTKEGAQEDLIDNREEVRLNYEMTYNEPDNANAKWNAETGTYTAPNRSIKITDGLSGDLMISDTENNTTKYTWQGSNQTTLNDSDYRFRSVTVTVTEYDSKYYKGNWTERVQNSYPASYEPTYVYIRTKDSDDFVLYKSFTGNNSTITLPENAVGIQIKHDSAFYCTKIVVKPTIAVLPSSKVLSIVEDDAVAGYNTLIKNKAICDVTENGETTELHDYSSRDAWLSTYVLTVSETTLYCRKNCGKESDAVSSSATGTVTMPALISGWNYNYSRSKKIDTCTFYDLLPVGIYVSKDTVAVVPRTGYDATSQVRTASQYNTYASKGIDSSYYTVSFEDNYMDSGQTMMTVNISVPSGFKYNDSVVTGYDVFYKMVSSYENIIKNTAIQKNCVAFANKTSGQPKPDTVDGTMNVLGDHQDYYITINSENFKRIAYYTDTTAAKEPSTFTWMFKNTVRGQNSQNFVKNETVGMGDDYTYKITYTQSQSITVKDLVFYDVLEQGMSSFTSEWHGEFTGLDISEIENLVSTPADPDDTETHHCKPVVYYSVKDRAQFTEDDYDITNTEVWTTVKPENSKITAIAIDCSKTDNGEDMRLSGKLSEESDEGNGFNFFISMKAPADYSLKKNNVVTVNDTSFKAYNDTEQIPMFNSAHSSVTLHKIIPQIEKTALPESGTELEPMGVVYNSEMKYTFAVTNPDLSMSIHDVKFEDVFPNGLTLLDGSFIRIGDSTAEVPLESSPYISDLKTETTANGTKLSFTISEIKKDETVYITVPVKVTVGSGTFKNTATLTGANSAQFTSPVNSNTTYHEVKPIEARIRKTDANGKLLSGAELKVYKYTDTYSGFSEDNLLLTISDTGTQWSGSYWSENVPVTEGTYVICETKTPDGYITADPMVFTIDVEGIIRVTGTVKDGKLIPVENPEAVTYLTVVNEPEWAVYFHINDPRTTHDDSTEIEEDYFKVYEPVNGSVQLSEFYDIPDFRADADEYVFAGWYTARSGGDPISYSDKYTKETHCYAQWIPVGTVDKDLEDGNIISGYRGFGLAGVQIREPQMYDDNYTKITPGGLRFITSLSEDLLSSIDALSTKQVEGNVDVEYGYAVGTEANINKFIDYYKVADTTAYTLQYKGENVNGKNTTVKGSGANTDYRYITNVNCTKGTGQIKNDHRNFKDYRLYTLVVTYDDADSADKKAEKIDARSYIRYYDANGMLRVFYNTYKHNMYYGGCMCSYNQVSSMALPSNKAETEENP